MPKRDKDLELGYEYQDMLAQQKKNEPGMTQEKADAERAQNQERQQKIGGGQFIRIEPISKRESLKQKIRPRLKGR